VSRCVRLLLPRPTWLLGERARRTHTPLKKASISLAAHPTRGSIPDAYCPETSSLLQVAPDPQRTNQERGLQRSLEQVSCKAEVNPMPEKESRPSCSQGRNLCRSKRGTVEFRSNVLCASRRRSKGGNAEKREVGKKGLD